MNFPLVSKKKWYAPENSLCPYCKENPINSIKGFAQISGGADEGNNGFLYLMFHQEPAEENENAAIFIAENINDGQFDIQFCSITCMRSFFNSICDELETRVKLK